MTRLALTGDVMLGRLVGQRLGEVEPHRVWGGLLPRLRGADGLIVNLECVIATGGQPWRPLTKVFHFRAGPEAVAVLQEAGVSCVSLANNHVLDFGAQALEECLERLDEAGIAHAGAGRDQEEAARPAFFDMSGLRVGLVGFTDNEPEWAAGPDQPGVNWVKIEPGHPSFARVEEGLRLARQGADLVVASFHWGPNMVRHPRPRFREYARRVIEAGADLFHGHSSHLFQGAAVHQGRLILHDCGDFVDDYAVDPQERNDLQFLYEVELEGTRQRRLEMWPARLRLARVDPAGPRQALWLFERMGSLCRAMGSELRQEPDHLALEVGREGEVEAGSSGPL